MINTARLKRFATEARNKLREGVKNKLLLLGFDAKGVATLSPIEVPGGAMWGDQECSIAFYRAFKALEGRLTQYGVNHVVEEAAYTWFNRLMAIRIMAKNELCEPVLQFVGTARTPMIVDQARQGHYPDMSFELSQQLFELLDDDTRTTEQFALLITIFCHNNPVIEACFGGVDDYTEILIPDNILGEGEFLDMLNSPDLLKDEDYHSSELLGWLYQFYISERKDQVFAKKGKYETDDIPAATQIFTPNWIVKYMVQNTVGGVLGGKEALPENHRKYYVDEPQGQESTASVRDIEELRTGDLACGSGHILCEMFDLLYDLYISEYYSRREAIECILKKNLIGIDIDNRACQLAKFALMLKACQKESSLIDASILPNILGMPEVSRNTYNDLDGHFCTKYSSQIGESIIKGAKCDELLNAFKLMENASVLGSIIKFDISESTRIYLQKAIKAYNADPSNESFKPLIDGYKFIIALTEHYDALVMNPPYMPTNKIDSLSNYVNEHYRAGKTDLFSVFMLVCIDRLRNGGRMGMINMQSWMFLSSFEEFRYTILSGYKITSMLHLGPHTFDELSGEVVQNTAFVICKVIPQGVSSGTYYRLVDGKNCSDKELMFLDDINRFANVLQNNFFKIPGFVIGYWVSLSVINLFSSENASEYAIFKHGMSTSDNNRFLRLWHEVCTSKILFAGTSKNDTFGYKIWFPYLKGGTPRKWWGNLNFIVNWHNDGEEIKEISNIKYPYLKGNLGFVLGGQDYFFQPGHTWSSLSSGKLAIRKFENGCLFDAKGQCYFSIDPQTGDYLMAFFNSKVFSIYGDLLSPTLDFNSGVISKAPLIIKDSYRVTEIARDNVEIAKNDWDSHETSWNFMENELVKISKSIGPAQLSVLEESAGISKLSLNECVDIFKCDWTKKFERLHANEENINRRFIEIYGLQDELSPEVPLNEITILQQGEIKIENNQLVWQDDVIIKQFLSYAVGCMMGRYRLDRPGLAIAHRNETKEEVEDYLIPNTNEKFWIDNDGIIPLMPNDCGFHDNASNRMATIVRQVFGDESQVENLNYIEQCLGKSIEQYFIKDFWKDHKKMYQNRPIYWLFASKKGTFQVLVYVHRMNVATVERIRVRYLLPFIDRLNTQINDLVEDEATLSTKERKRLQDLRRQVVECTEYYNRLAVIAEQGIVPDLDAGIIANHALYGDVVSKLK